MEIKPHLFARLVNELRDTAANHHDKQCLRELIAKVLIKNGIKPEISSEK